MCCPGAEKRCAGTLRWGQEANRRLQRDNEDRAEESDIRGDGRIKMAFAPHVHPYMAGPPTPSPSTPYGSYPYPNQSNYAASGPSGPSTPAPQAQPVTRSRTLFYLSVKDSSGPSYSRSRRRGKGVRQDYGDTVDVAEEEERVGLMGPERGLGPGEGGLPPRWYVPSNICHRA